MTEAGAYMRYSQESFCAAGHETLGAQNDFHHIISTQKMKETALARECLTKTLKESIFIVPNLEPEGSLVL